MDEKKSFMLIVNTTGSRGTAGYTFPKTIRYEFTGNGKWLTIVSIDEESEKVVKTMLPEREITYMCSIPNWNNLHKEDGECWDQFPSFRRTVNE